MYYLPSSCLVFFFLFSLFYPQPCASSNQELELCETLFHCGHFTAGFPFWGGARHKLCGHPLLKLRCNKNNSTSLITSDQEFSVLHLNQTSNTLTLTRTDHMGSFCSSKFTNTTLPSEIFELSPTYKTLTVFYDCNPYSLQSSRYKCPKIGFISVFPKYYDSCLSSFTVNVPTSFVSEERDYLNMTNLESILRKGFEVKVKIDERACQECSSSHEFCGINETLPLGVKCGPLHPPTADEHHVLCSTPFPCGDQNDLFYPFWNPDREECGHPEFKLECTANVAEVSISSVKFRILEANRTSRTIKLARSDYISSFCPQNPLNVSFSENILQLAPGTEPLTIYYRCSEFRTSTYIGQLDCDDGNSYYVTRSLSPPQLPSRSCIGNITIPTSRPALNTLERDPTPDNLKRLVEEGFELRLNRECLMCMDSGGVCGYNQTFTSSGFVCYCTDKPHTRTCGSRSKHAALHPGAIAGIVAAFGSVTFFLIAGGLFCLINRRRRTSEDPIQQNLKALIPLRHYSYAQLRRITNSFAEVVGKGGFGTVYRGTLCDGRRVAVKVLKDSKSNNGEDFINEVASMSQTSHVNIVTLLGFCSEGSNRAILYEFLENGSLDKFISSKRSSNMDWTALYKIALGVARGLEYLHHGCRTRIVHFDIKPQNVLLDDNICPKVADFGLAKLCERKESILSLLDARGTIGYIAPEVFSRVYGRVSHKSDVYSYGMLVLEMVGARTRTSTEDTASSTSSMYFPEWIYKDLEKGDNGRLTENGINSEEEEIAKKMTLVGLWCIQSWPSNRPPMNRVVEMMEGNLNVLELPPKPVLQIPAGPLQESSMTSEVISGYTEVCSMNVT